MQIFKEKQENLLQENLKLLKKKTRKSFTRRYKNFKKYNKQIFFRRKKRNICRRFKTNKA